MVTDTVTGDNSAFDHMMEEHRAGRAVLEARKRGDTVFDPLDSGTAAHQDRRLGRRIILGGKMLDVRFLWGSQWGSPTTRHAPQGNSDCKHLTMVCHANGHQLWLPHRGLRAEARGGLLPVLGQRPPQLSTPALLWPSSPPSHRAGLQGGRDRK